ncbi:MAG: molybdopterin dinucleotide binding domain-containing protein [Ilumatobacteraceae bacterium]
MIIPGRAPFAESHYDVFFSQYACRNTARFSPPILDDPGLPADWQAMVRTIAILQGDGAAADLDVVDERLLRHLLAAVPDEHAGGIVAALGDRVGADRRIDLALRSGPYGDRFGAVPDGLSLDRLVAHPDGLDLGPLVERLPDALRTPSGTIELADPALLGELHRAAAELTAPVSTALTIVGRRHLRSNNSWMHNLPSLMRGRPRCTLEVHPDDAAVAGLTTGDLASVTAAGGASITVPVEVTDAVRRGVISLPHGWGHDVDGTRLSLASATPGANLNALTDADTSEHLTGTAVLGGIEVTLARR